MSVPKISGYAFQSLARALRHATALRAKAIGPKLREQIILRVSSVNGCNVCSAVHGAAARVGGLTSSDVHRARTPDDDESLDEQTRLLLHYAEIRTANLERDYAEQVEAFERTFSEEVKREVRAVVDLFTFNNRFNNTWEGVLPGASKRRERLGLAPR